MLELLLALMVSGAAEETTATPASAPSRERLVCRTRPGVGSRITRQRVCKTVEEWRLYDNDLRNAQRDNNDQSRGPTVRNEGLFPCTPQNPCSGPGQAPH